LVYIDTNALYTVNCYIPIQRNITTDAKNSLLSLTIAYFTSNVTTERFWSNTFIDFSSYTFHVSHSEQRRVGFANAHSITDYVFRSKCPARVLELTPNSYHIDCCVKILEFIAENTRHVHHHPHSLLHSSSAGSQNSTVSLTNTSYSLFFQKRLTVRHVLSITALCRQQGEDRAVSSRLVICLE